MLSEAKLEALNRLRTVHGQLDGIMRMVDAEACCLDLVKQIAVTQASLERVNRVVLRNHLQTCFSEAVESERTQAAVAELLDAVGSKSVLAGPEASLDDG